MEMFTVQEAITIAIAAWGAITGTLALVLRFVRFSKDRPKLVPEVEMEYESSFELPLEASALLEVTNSGRRPATIDAFLVEFENHPRWKRWSWLPNSEKPKQYYLRRSFQRDAKKIGEGDHVSIRFKDSSLPSDYRLSDVEQIVVRDKTGKEWLADIEQIESYKERRDVELLRTDDFEDGDKEVSLRLYEYSNLREFSVRVRFAYPAMEYESRRMYRRFESYSEADDCYEEILEGAEKLVEGVETELDVSCLNR